MVCYTPLPPHSRTTLTSLSPPNRRFLIFPQGNATEHVSLYVDYVGPKEGKWHLCAQFALAVLGEEGPVSKGNSILFWATYFELIENICAPFFLQRLTTGSLRRRLTGVSPSSLEERHSTLRKRGRNSFWMTL